jgi:TonB family protein
VTKSQWNAPPTKRLVIRVKLPTQEPLPSSSRPRLSRRALLLLILGVVAVPVCWLGISTFRSHSAVTKRASNSESLASVAVRSEDSSVVSDKPPPKPAVKTTVTNSAEGEARSVESEVRQQPDARPSTVNEVIPEVPRSALETIRGTVRVSVRVIVDRQGNVVAASADGSGPSRYFERLSVEASKNWTFTPASSDEQRIMLVRFNFTRAGATAHASPVH